MQKISNMYERALEVGSFAIWEWNIKSNKMSIHFKHEGMLKYVEKAFDNPYEFINTFAISEDRAAALTDLEIFMNNCSEKYSSEMRIEAGGQLKWILIEGKMFGTDDKKYLSGTIHDITHRKQVESEVGLFIYYDALTGFPNRSWLMENFNELFKSSQKDGSSMAVIFIDIENLKAVNNSYGNEAGDLFLKLFSQLLTACKRDEDKILRSDGDEFMLIMPGVETRAQVWEACKNILEFSKNPFEIKNRKIFISLSMGAAFYPEDTTEIQDLLMFANLAMYQAKKMGKNKTAFYEKHLGDSYIRGLAIEHELKNALKNDEFYLLFQPQYDISSNMIMGFEALLRWNSSALGMVSPAEFVPIAEKTGDIVEIGEIVIRKAARTIIELKNTGCPFQRIAINVSPLQLRKKNFLPNIEKLFEKSHIPLSMLEIEITEGTLIDTHKDKLNLFKEMIEKGINIAIDDFGTGYSSLNYLTMLPISTLKIDKSFIDNISDKKNRAVIQCIINLSKIMKYTVLAEGVESREQVEILKDYGCEIIQGYYFSKPVSENEIISLLNIYNGGGNKIG